MTFYPKATPIAGTIIRNLKKNLQTEKFNLLKDSHIHIAVSGGSDSVGLGHLLIKYGRRVVEKGRIRVVHVDHGWRGKQSSKDAEWVRRFFAKHEVPVTVYKLSEQPQKSESWENEGRKQREKIYSNLLNENPGDFLFTAHTQDDQVETLLWRVLTGAPVNSLRGIRARKGRVFRPLLGVTKAQIQAYLKTEKIKWREDATNWEGKFLRSQVRLYLNPALQKVFPNYEKGILGFQRQIQNLLGPEEPLN